MSRFHQQFCRLETMKTKFKSIIEILKRQRVWILAIEINFLIACIVFIPVMASNNWIFTLCEDYNGETIPYRFLANQAIKSGDIFWNWNIDLGSDFIQSFASVGLFSPFYVLSLLAPARFLLYINGWLIILKFAVAGSGAALYLERYIHSTKVIIIGSILYAFSGFQLCLLVFDMLADVSIFFPFLLWALDSLIDDGKYRRLTIMAFLLTLCSVSNFVSQVVFLVIYFVIKYGEFDVRFVKRSLLCLKEGIIGVIMAGIVFVPEVYALANDARAGVKLMGENALSYDSTTLLLILRAFIMPSEAMSNGSSIVETNWDTVAAYLPVVGITYLISFFRKRSNTWIKRINFFLLFFVVIPFLNNSFMLETAGGYKRWYFMLILMQVLASAQVLEQYQKYDVKKSSWCSFLVLLVFALSIKFIKWNQYGPLPIFRPQRFTVGLCISFIGILVCGSVNILKRRYINTMLVAVIVGAICTGFLSCYDYKQKSLNSAAEGNSTREVLNEVVNTGQVFDDLNIQVLPYRTHFWRTYYNYGMPYQIPSRTSFFSVIDSSINRFYEALGTPRNTAFTPNGVQGIEELLSVKYYVCNPIEQDFNDYQLVQSYSNGNRQLKLYEDVNALPVGYAYNSYMTHSEFERLPSELRGQAMLCTLVIPDDKEELVGRVLRHNSMKFPLTVSKSQIEHYKNSHNEVITDFSKTAKAFSANIKVDADKYTFFSVPHSRFWKAYVNQNPVEIIDINGMMAIPVTEGNNSIDFIYDPIITYIGLGFSIFGFVMFGIYHFTKTNRPKGQRYTSIRLRDGLN